MLPTRLLTKKFKNNKAEDKCTAKTVQSRIHPHSVLVTNHGISGNRKSPSFWQKVELSHELSPILCYICTSAELTQTVLALLVSSPTGCSPQRKQLSQKCCKGRRPQKSSSKSHPGETPAFLTERADKAQCTCPPAQQHQARCCAQDVTQWVPGFLAPQAFANRAQAQQLLDIRGFLAFI